jgi:hypothetical protein
MDGQEPDHSNREILVVTSILRLKPSKQFDIYSILSITGRDNQAVVMIAETLSSEKQATVIHTV